MNQLFEKIYLAFFCIAAVNFLIWIGLRYTSNIFVTGVIGATVGLCYFIGNPLNNEFLAMNWIFSLYVIPAMLLLSLNSLLWTLFFHFRMYLQYVGSARILRLPTLLSVLLSLVIMGIIAMDTITNFTSPYMIHIILLIASLVVLNAMLTINNYRLGNRINIYSAVFFVLGSASLALFLYFYNTSLEEADGLMGRIIYQSSGGRPMLSYLTRFQFELYFYRPLFLPLVVTSELAIIFILANVHVSYKVLARSSRSNANDVALATMTSNQPKHTGGVSTTHLYPNFNNA